MMAEEAAGLIALICSRLGSVEFETLVQEAGVPDLETVIENSKALTVIQQNSSKTVLVTSNLRRCKGECRETCPDLHLCKFHLLGQCNMRHRCKYGHSLETEHNSEVLRQHGFQDLSRDDVRVILLLNDGSLLPNVCVAYNKGSDEFGNCPDKEVCTRLHVCEKYIRGRCDGSGECTRCHDFHEPHPWKTLKARGVGSQLVGSLPLIYRNILTLKEHRNAQSRPATRSKENLRSGDRSKESARRNADVICLSFIRGHCKYGEKCWRVHFGLPYKWEVEVDGVWIELPDNAVIERSYCDPDQSQSVGREPVCFDTMTQGLHRVRRLSTVSSVMEPSFIHTTKWIWYWQNEYNSWIQYGSHKEMHRLSSITSEELEKKYHQFLMDKTHETAKFTAGKHFYELNFRDMKQRNEVSDTERAVRRRPFFVSLFDVGTTRPRRLPSSSSRSHPGVPGFWDKSAIPDSGFQRVLLDASHRDYIRVKELFSKTMEEFSILTIERVQNKELWEDFQTKKERMKRANSDTKYGDSERLLFHGTNGRNIDAICRQNVDMRVSGANATVYGQGSYFAWDAKYSNGYTDHYGDRSVFACRVLVGRYAKGASHYRRPPERDAARNLYDSCVNDVRDPTVYVIFERSQVYPEFLITYEKSRIPKDLGVVQAKVGVPSATFDASGTASGDTSSSAARSSPDPDPDVLTRGLTSRSWLLDQSLGRSDTIPGSTRSDPESIAQAGVDGNLQKASDPSSPSPDKAENASSTTCFPDTVTETRVPNESGSSPDLNEGAGSSHETRSPGDVGSFHNTDDVIQSAFETFSGPSSREELVPSKPAQVSSSISTGRSAEILNISARSLENSSHSTDHLLLHSKRRSNPDSSGSPTSSSISVMFTTSSSSVRTPSGSKGSSSVSFRETPPVDVSSKQLPVKSPDLQRASRERNVTQAQNVKVKECVVQ